MHVCMCVCASVRETHGEAVCCDGEALVERLLKEGLLVGVIVEQQHNLGEGSGHGQRQREWRRGAMGERQRQRQGQRQGQRE